MAFTKCLRQFNESCASKNLGAINTSLIEYTENQREIKRATFVGSSFKISYNENILIQTIFESCDLQQILFHLKLKLKNIDITKPETAKIMNHIYGYLSFLIKVDIELGELPDILIQYLKVKKNISAFSKFLEYITKFNTSEVFNDPNEKYIIELLLKLKEMLNDINFFQFAYYLPSTTTKFLMGSKTSTDLDVAICSLYIDSFYIDYKGHKHTKSTEFIAWTIAQETKIPVDLGIIIFTPCDSTFKYDPTNVLYTTYVCGVPNDTGYVALDVKTCETLNIIHATHLNHIQHESWEEYNEKMKLMKYSRTKNDLLHKLYNLIEASSSLDSMCTDKDVLDILRRLKDHIKTRNIKCINFKELLNLYISLISCLESKIDSGISILSSDGISILSSSSILDYIKKITLRILQALWLFLSPPLANLNFMYNTFEHIIESSKLPLIKEIFGKENPIQKLGLFMFRFIKGNIPEYHDGQLVSTDDFKLFLHFVKSVIIHINENNKPIELQHVIQLISKFDDVIAIFEINKKIIILTKSYNDFKVFEGFECSFIAFERNLSRLHKVKPLYSNESFCLYRNKINTDPCEYDIIKDIVFALNPIGHLHYKNTLFIIVLDDTIKSEPVTGLNIVIMSLESLISVIQSDFIRNPIYYMMIIMLLINKFDIYNQEKYDEILKYIRETHQVMVYLNHHKGREYKLLSDAQTTYEKSLASEEFKSTTSEDPQIIEFEESKFFNYTSMIFATLCIYSPDRLSQYPFDKMDILSNMDVIKHIQFERNLKVSGPFLKIKDSEKQKIIDSLLPEIKEAIEKLITFVFVKDVTKKEKFLTLSLAFTKLCDKAF